MASEIVGVPEAGFIEGPRDPDIEAIYNYWMGLRGDRKMPRRADIDPIKIARQLPYVFMYNVLPNGGGYTIRLAGEELARFAGSNPAGRPAGSTMTPRGADAIVRLLDAVVAERVALFRAGRMYWQPERGYRDFEACLLPLSSDGEAVDIVFGGVKAAPL